jgi:hypothetical protein
MTDSTQQEIERAESLLRPLMQDSFRANYTPDFPRRDGSPARWFQVVFAVGPGESAALRAQVHELFPQMLAALAQVSLVAGSDLVSLGARRHCPDSEIYRPEHPFMFIEAAWSGTAVRGMRDRRDFSVWSAECITYWNHFDAQDVFTRGYAGQPVC